MRKLSNLFTGPRGRKVLKTALVSSLILWLLALATEVTIAVVAPNEILGWGEKPALRRDPEFGWRLVELQTTRLRWGSYDYIVTSNSLGFPGPEFAEKAPMGVFRIMTVGSGFTSAEGVDTDESWPRILENVLNDHRGFPPVQVLNFAVTGYGPRQYAAVIEKFAPIYEPDLILIAMIPNDLRKVMTAISTQQKSIGFDLPYPNDPYSILTCKHLTGMVRDTAKSFVYRWIRHRLSPSGYFYGQIWAFEKGQDSYLDESQDALEECLATIKASAETSGSSTLLLLVPASVQVCSPHHLEYLPDNFIWGDSKELNAEQPQIRMAESATKIGSRYADLRLAFDLDPDPCPYQPSNLHWTANGHRQIAAFLADQLLKQARGEVADPPTKIEKPTAQMLSKD